MQQDTTEAYGLFAFLLITQALANGISNAVLGAPLLIVLSEEEYARDRKVSSFMQANLLLCVIFSVVQGLVAWLYTSSTESFVVYAISGFLVTLRWFGRSYCNNNQQHAQVVKSDATFSLLTLIGTIGLFYFNKSGLNAFGALIAICSAVAIPQLGKEYLKLQIFGAARSNSKAFIEGYRKQGKYALVGVLSTEATLNAHSYLITTLLGPAAFAPIAAAALLFRPISLVLSSLSQVERPRLRRLIANRQADIAKSSLTRFTFINIGFWLGNVVAAALVITFFIEEYWKDAETQMVLVNAVFIYTFINLAKSFRNPLSVYLQSNDEFKSLGLVTVSSALLTVPLVYFLIIQKGVTYSLLGILIGELFAMLLMFLLCTKKDSYL